MQVGTVYSGTLKLDLNLILLERSNDLWIAQNFKMEYWINSCCNDGFYTII